MIRHDGRRTRASRLSRALVAIATCAVGLSAPASSWATQAGTGPAPPAEEEAPTVGAAAKAAPVATVPAELDNEAAEVVPSGAAATPPPVRPVEVLPPPPPVFASPPLVVASAPPAARRQVPRAAYVAGGVAVVAAAVGTLFGLEALRQKNSFDSGDNTTGRAEAIEKNALLADMSFGAGIAFGVTALAMWLQQPEDGTAYLARIPPRGTSVVLTPMLTRVAPGASAMVRF